MTRVLVVEDETSYSEALSYVLRKEGFDVAIAETGPDALTEFERGGADIVLLDLMLPGLPGTEVCRQLRQTSSVPIIMVSAKDTEVDKVVGLELGADDYVTKPYSPRELVARIRAVLAPRRGRGGRRGRRPRGRPRAHGRRAPPGVGRRRHGQAAAEGVRAARVLPAQPGPVLTRGQLIDRVWGADYVGDTKTLDVHVKRLRAKIEPDPGNPITLTTVRGLGYKLDA
ncbi:MAG: response regulator transcription factor [Aeromicrobium erythreum]